MQDIMSLIIECGFILKGKLSVETK